MRYFSQVLSLFILFSALTDMQKIDAKEDWQRVYLCSYTRSGNHWLRSLIEEATGIATSAVYRDKVPPHLSAPFPWGGYAAEHGYEGNCRYPQPGEIVVIKTHYPQKSKTQFDLKPAVKYIRIVRHPIDAFYSHYLHQGNELPDDGKIPSWYVQRSVFHWHKFETFWNHKSNVFTVRYEDLLDDIHFHFREILNSIGYQLSEEDINRAIAKFPPQGDKLKHLHDYHASDLKLISKKLGGLMKKYDYELED